MGEDHGFWQGMLMEKEDAHAIFSGDSVVVTAHTGKQLEVEGISVGARFNDHGLWQTFVIDNNGGRAITSGDAVYLVAHTGSMVDVDDSESAQARWHDRGNWQRFFIHKNGGRTIFPGDSIFLEAHTGKLIDIQGTEVKACWTERGTWQSLVIGKVTSRRLGSHTISFRSSPQFWSEPPSSVDSGDSVNGSAIGVLVVVLLALCIFVFVMQRGSKKSGHVTVQEELLDCESPSVRTSVEG